MTARDRRALLAGLAIVGAAVLLLRVVPRAMNHVAAMRETLAARADMLARAQADVRAGAGLEESVRVARGRMLALAPRILSGASEAEASADLTGRLDALAAKRQLKLDRAEALPDSARAGRLRRVTLRAYLEGDTGGLLAMLAAAARDSAVLPVERVRLMAMDPSSADGVPEVLRAEVTVRGWYLARAERTR